MIWNPISFLILVMYHNNSCQVGIVIYIWPFWFFFMQKKFVNSHKGFWVYLGFESYDNAFILQL